MEITLTNAIVILEACGVCYNEGIGPDYRGLVLKIYEHWPALKTAKLSWTPNLHILGED